MSTSPTSRYANDPRVEWPEQGYPPEVMASIPDPTIPDPTIPDPTSENSSRLVVASGNRFEVVGATGDDATLRDPGDRYNQRRQSFATMDEAIYAVIGEPQVAA